MTEVVTEVRVLSSFCLPGSKHHGFCANRDLSETHCECECHGAKRPVDEWIRIRYVLRFVLDPLATKILTRWEGRKDTLLGAEGVEMFRKVRERFFSFKFPATTRETRAWQAWRAWAPEGEA